MFSKLGLLSNGTKVEQFNLGGPRSGGSLFFEHGTDEFIGLVAVQRDNDEPLDFKAPEGWGGERIS